MTATVALVRPTPRDAQQVFRAVLDALSRPGQECHIPVLAGPECGIPDPALLPLLALADLETPVALLGGREWVEPVATVTSAPVVDSRAARIVAALRPVTVDELNGLRRGTPATPEDAALVTLAVPALTGGPDVRISGPGIRADIVITPGGLPTGWLAARTGIDLLLVAPDGTCLGIPRSTKGI